MSYSGFPLSIYAHAHSSKMVLIEDMQKLFTVPSTNIGTLDKYEQRRLWK